MNLLKLVNNPKDLDKFNYRQLEKLTQEIRDYLIENISKTGGHLGSNLGIIELTIGIHRVFDSPKDSIIFDTGHQTYVHKILTGRKNFKTLRQENGLSGYPSRVESNHDILENSHASSSLSWAYGISCANLIKNNLHNIKSYTIALIGDGALTGGMAWEAINNIIFNKKNHFIIIINDNGRSYSPTIGNLAHYLSYLKNIFLNKKYKLKKIITQKKNYKKLGYIIFNLLSFYKKKYVNFFLKQKSILKNIGIKYIGPIDGHNLKVIENNLNYAKSLKIPVILHVITEKGHGYPIALSNKEDKLHAIGVIDIKTGKPINNNQPIQKSWTAIFSDTVVDIAKKNKNIVCITCAMLIPVGLKKFAEKYPSRIFDVGIAEQHAVAFSAGLSFSGLHPIIAVYSVFLNRAFDQILMDVALHKVGITFILDRSGITGPDGPSHHGIWDMSILQNIPHLHLNSPRDGRSLKNALKKSIKIKNAPSVIRFPKGIVNKDIKTIKKLKNGIEIIFDNKNILQLNEKNYYKKNKLLIISIGAMATLSIKVANNICKKHKVHVTIVDPKWILPINLSFLQFMLKYKLIITIEDGVSIGGIGFRLKYELSKINDKLKFIEFGFPTKFIKQGTRSQIFDKFGMTVNGISKVILKELNLK